MTAEDLSPFMWVPQAVVSMLAAVAWTLTAVVVSRNKFSSLQFASVVLGCAHMAGAGRSVLVGLGAVPTDPLSAAIHFATAAACLSVSVCIIRSSLAEAWKPHEPCEPCRVTPKLARVPVRNVQR